MQQLAMQMGEAADDADLGPAQVDAYMVARHVVCN